MPLAQPSSLNIKLKKQTYRPNAFMFHAQGTSFPSSVSLNFDLQHMHVSACKKNTENFLPTKDSDGKRRLCTEKQHNENQTKTNPKINRPFFGSNVDGKIVYCLFGSRITSKPAWAQQTEIRNTTTTHNTQPTHTSLRDLNFMFPTNSLFFAVRTRLPSFSTTNTAN